MQQFDASNVYAEFAPKIYRFCLRLSGNRTDAEDLTAETLNTLVGSRIAFEGRSSIDTYLYRIARNRWRMLVRREKIRRLLGAGAPQSGVEVDVGRVALGIAIDRLSPKLKESFLLVRAEGLTHKEAAEILRCPVGTVQARVFQATKNIRAALIEVDPQFVPDEVALKEVRS
jgi:RNA polymerase sigma-70 factor (ECF subfamily)